MASSSSAPRYYQADDAAAQQELERLHPPRHPGDGGDGAEEPQQHDHEGLLSLSRLHRGVALAWLLVLGTGLLLMGVLLWMGTAPSLTVGPPGATGHRNTDRVASVGSTTDPAAPAIATTTELQRVNYTAEALADEVTALPGMPLELKGAFRQFAGYLPISTDKNVFYWFVEAAAPLDPTTAPLTLWTNGGPGCSGLFGLLEEMGPFRPTKDGGSLAANPLSWNRLSNVVYVEVPVGVGFSFSRDPKDYRTGDQVTAQDNLRAVQAFFDKFPHLRANDFYIASESYGGHYIPQLAQEIVLHNMGPYATTTSKAAAAAVSGGVGDDQGGIGNDQGQGGVRRGLKNMKGKGKKHQQQEEQHSSYDAAGRINLKGILVGNPYTDPVENLVGMIDALWGRDLIPASTYETWASTCVKGDPDAYYSKACVDLQNKVWEQLGGDDVDPYALDWPVCVADLEQHHHEDQDQDAANARRAKAAGRNQRYRLAAHAMKGLISQEVFARPSWSGPEAAGRGGGLPFEPCEEDYATAYLNRADVQAALHVEGAVAWEDCTDRVDYNDGDQLLYMEPLYNFLLAATDGDLRILIISGDDDSVCGTRGTELWLTRMGWKVVTSWRPWHVNGQVAGYKKAFANGVTFMTVHGAGHEVPMYKPAASYEFFQAFLEDRLDEL